MKGCADVKVLDAMLASLNPGMERAEDDGEIEGFFAFGPVEGRRLRMNPPGSYQNRFRSPLSPLALSRR